MNVSVYDVLCIALHLICLTMLIMGGEEVGLKADISDKQKSIDF
jgi:hypothetical protein